MANFIEIFPVADKGLVFESISQTLNKSNKSAIMYKYFCQIYEKYLYNPNSPIRNEVFYEPVLKFIQTNESTDLADKERTSFILEMINKNKVGELATNITYTLESGKKATLYDINTDFTILMFYNPDCKACSELITRLRASAVIDSFHSKKALSILAIYPDSDIDIWKKHISEIPNWWINGYDKYAIINQKQLYDLKAIPTLYLLDKDKKIVLKDADFGILEEWLYDYSVPKVMAIN